MYEVIGVLGDSIANGYWDEEGKGWFGRLAEMIARKYPRKYGFNNMAQDGDRIFDIFHRLHAEAMTRDFDVLLIACGGNDIIRWGSPDAPTDLSPGLREEMWQKVLDGAVKAFSRVLVIGLLPEDEGAYPQEGAFGRMLYAKNADREEYNAMMEAMCEKHGARFLHIEAFRRMDFASLFADACHPNARGHAVYAEAVFAELQKLGWVKE